MKKRRAWGAASGGLLPAIILTAAAPVWAETLVLESAALRLEVETEPYRYRVIDRSNGTVLVHQAAVTFTAVPSAPQPPDAGAPDAGDAGAADAAGDARDAGDASVVDAASDAPTVPPPTPRELRVLRAQRSGGDATSLTLALIIQALDQPASARFSFTSAQQLTVALEGAGATRIKEDFEDQGEHIHGVWEYPFDRNLDNRGHAADYLGFGEQAGSLYTSARAPFYLTSRNYGVYVRSSARGRFSFALGGRTFFQFDEGKLTYEILHGAGYADLLTRYTALVGGPSMPPLWAFGSVWWHDDFHRDLRGRANAQENVLDLAQQLRAHKIPASGLLIDRPYGTGTQGWGNFDWDSSFPDPPAMVKGLNDRGLQLVLWIANRAWNNLYTEGRNLGYLFPGVSQNTGPATDLRIPAAYNWWKSKLAPLVELGAKGYKIDRGEQGEHPGAVQNDNVTLFARLADETLRAKHGDSFIITRNVADSGRKHTAVWNGDSEANFDGLAYSVAAGLRSGLIVMPIWGSDTGGYLRNAGAPNEEVFARWFGFSAWSPVMEVLVGDGHTPWYDYSPALVAIARQHATTHHDHIPYTRSMVYQATQTGLPVMRAMLLEAPDEPQIENLSDQYLYGTELLVAPVIVPGASARSVFVPGGRWLDYGDRRRMAEGPRDVLLEAPLDTVPVLVREGGIVPRGDILRANNDWTPDWAARLRIELYPAARDLDRRFPYYTGSAVADIRLATQGGTARVEVGALGLPATLELQLERHGKVSRDGTVLGAGRDFSFDPATRKLSIPHDGSPATFTIEGAVSLFATATPLPAGRRPGDPSPSVDAGADGGPGTPGRGCAFAATRGDLPALLLLAFALIAVRRRPRTRR